jgi:Ca2+-transporting ATPase
VVSWPPTIPLNGPPWVDVLRALALCNDRGAGAALGRSSDPTENALVEAAAIAGVGKAWLEAATPRVAEIGFTAERGLMTTLHREGPGLVAYTKGAPERVLERCSAELGPEGIRPLDREALRRQAEALAAQGLRVLAVAMRREATSAPAPAEWLAESELVFLGLVGLADPLRPEATASVATCRAAGIVPIMITGDHAETARAVARELGLIGPGGPVVTGAELAGMPEAELERVVRDTRVFARITPADKLRIVEALQRGGALVAMTGDGVNDAPALKRAHVGVAMGLSGTDVAREAADLVLLDDNVATIVAAVKEGRRVFDNIRKFVRFVLAGNLGEIWVLALAPLIGLPLPLLPIQILWVNLLTDGLPGLALTAEPAEAGAMRRPPRAPDQGIFADGLGVHVLWVGLLIGGVSLLAQAGSYHSGSGHWRTMVFTVLALAQLAHLVAIRRDHWGGGGPERRSNPLLLVTVLLTALLQVGLLYLPACNRLLGTDPLGATELAICFLLAGSVAGAVGIEKILLARRRPASGGPVPGSLPRVDPVS